MKTTSRYAVDRRVLVRGKVSVKPSDPNFMCPVWNPKKRCGFLRKQSKTCWFELKKDGRWVRSKAQRCLKVVKKTSNINSIQVECYFFFVFPSSALLSCVFSLQPRVRFTVLPFRGAWLRMDLIAPHQRLCWRATKRMPQTPGDLSHRKGL